LKIKLLSEHGYNEAILGLSLSYNTTTKKAMETAELLAKLDGGHNKFLESICVWLDITAPRYWWQQFDTYRIGVTKQSESTMHTLLRQPLTDDSFEGMLPVWIKDQLNTLIEQKRFDELK
jgi:hypothetical protein